jgi:hypothetical protein
MLKKKLIKNSLTALAMMSSMAFSSVSSAALVSYSQNWESSVTTDGAAISSDGWVIGNFNVTTGGAWFENFPSPNCGDGGCNGYAALVDGQGGAAQGSNQLSIFGDYNPWGPWANSDQNTIETYVIRDIGTVDASEEGQTFSFGFDAKLGNLDSSVGATNQAFVKVLQQSNGSYDTLFEGYFDAGSNLTTDWSGGAIELLIDAGMVGELVQIGFVVSGTEAADGAWPGTGVYYDNLGFAEVSAVPVPAAVWLFGSGLLGLVGVARRKKS